MQCNVGQKDKKLRIYGGIALLLTAISFKSALMAIIGVLLIISGFTRKCLLFKMIGFDSNKYDGGTTPKE